MTGEHYDIAIVGGGVAGCAASIQLARRGHKVVLLETQKYPHHKVCGEFMSPECNFLLADLGLTPAIQAIGPAQIHTVVIAAPDGTSWQSRLPGVGLGISRYALDNIMAEEARACGVDLRENTTVTDIEGGLAKTFTLTTRTVSGSADLCTKLVIGAYGKRSNLDRRLRRSFLQSNHPFIGLKAHFRGSPSPGQIHLYTFPGGYCGMSEIENGQVNVCLLVRQEVFQSTPNISRFIEWMKKQNPTLGRWLTSAEQVEDNWLTIAQIPFADKEIVVNDILMTGDSAGLIAPIAGDGMGMALQASRILSKLTDDYLSERISAESLKQHYTTLWWRTFGTRLRLSHALQAFMLRPQWLTPGLHLVNAVPALGRLLVTYTRDNALVRR